MRKECAISVLAVLAVSAQVRSATTRFAGHVFEARLISSGHSPLSERSNRDGASVSVRNGQEYSILVRNPLPVRVAVAVSVDGLNTIDGKRVKPAESAKWIIEPYSSVTIDGWQTGMKTLRRFVFTPQRNTYAQWKQNADGRDYVSNLGVIGIAWFWSSADLHDALNPPIPFAGAEPDTYSDKSGPAPSAAAKSRSDRSASAAPERAGTGMGRRQQNSVVRVHFDYDAGMFTNADVLRIYYEFGRSKPSPSPFEETREEVTSGFAPDMWR